MQYNFVVCGNEKRDVSFGCLFIFTQSVHSYLFKSSVLTVNYSEDKIRIDLEYRRENVGDGGDGFRGGCGGGGVRMVVVVMMVAVSSSIEVTNCTFCTCAKVSWMRRKRIMRNDEDEFRCSMSIYSPTNVNMCT